MKCLRRLIVIYHLKLEQSSQIHQKPLTRFDMKVYFISSSLWVSRENFIIFFKTTYQVDSKGLFKTDKPHRGEQF